MLLLNADYQPLSYFPLSVVSWKEAIKALFLDRVNVVAEYNEEVHSPTTTMRIPSVVALKEYVMPQKKPPFNRFNLYLRDGFECQYCGEEGHIKGFREGATLTLDHVYPKSRGGHLNWLNTVAACQRCNIKKGNMTPQEASMPLRRKPFVPSQYNLKNVAKNYPLKTLHETWLDFLDIPAA